MNILYPFSPTETKTDLRSKTLFPLFSLVLLLFAFQVSKAQISPDSIIFSTDGKVYTTILNGHSLYMGGDFSYLGNKTGPVAFFLNGSDKPAAGMPLAGDLRSYWSSDKVLAVVPDGTGGWFLGGSFNKISNRNQKMLVHILADKTVDPAWNFSWESGNKINVLKTDGAFLYAGGNFSINDGTGKLHKLVVRFNLKTHSIDPGWNPDLSGSGYVEQIEIGNNKVILSGWLDKVDGYQQDALVILDKVTGKRLLFPTTSSVTAMKLMGDTLLIGQPDLYWSSYPDGFGYIAKGLVLLDKNNDFPQIPQPIAANFDATVPDGSGGWYAAGDYNRNGIFHFDKDFKEVTGFSENLITSVGLAPRLLLHGNSLYVARFFKSVDVNGTAITSVYKLNAATGEIDAGFHPNPNGDVKTVLAKGDTLFIGGTFDTVAGEFRPGLAALNTTTGALLPWKPEINFDNFEAGFTGPERFITSLLLKNDTLYAGGRFQVPAPQFTKGGTGIYGLVRYNMQTGDLDTTFHIHTSYYDNPLFTGMAFHSNQLYIVGRFNLTRNEIHIKNAGIFNLSTKKLSPVNPDLEFVRSGSLGSNIYDIPQVAVVDDRIYFWGMSATNTATGEKRNYFVSLNGTDNQFTDWNPLPNYSVNSFSAYGGKFLLSGDFYFLKHYPNNFGGIDLQTGKYVNFPNVKTVYALAVTDKYIFLGGDFTYYKDSVVNGLCRLKRNDLSFTSFHHGIRNDNAKAHIGVLSTGDNGLYVVGRYTGMFNLVAGVERQNICLLDPETAQLKAWNPPHASGKIYRVFSFGPDAVVSGAFGLMPSWSRYKIARINLNTGLIDDWNPIISGYFPTVYTMLVSGDTVYLAGKGIKKINGVDAGNLSAVSATSGSLHTGFTPASLSGGYGDDNIAVLTKNGNALYVAGDFKSISGNDRNCLAKINSATGVVESWDVHLQAGWNPVEAILPTDSVVYIGGEDLQVDGNSETGNLLKADVVTGALKKVYSKTKGKIYALATNNRGDMAIGENLKQGFFLLDKAGDSLVPVSNLTEFKYGPSKIKSLGHVFLAAGNRIEEYGSFTAKPGLVAYNPVQDTMITAVSFPVLQGNLSTFAANKEILALGGEFLALNAEKGNENIAFTATPQLYLQPGITSWNPKKANTADPFALSVYGSGFNDKSIVKLSKGNKNLAADSLKITDRRIIAYFNGKDFTTGKWDLEVKINDSTTKSFAGALNIAEGSTTDVWVDWLGPDRTLANKPTTYYLLFGNRGDRDAYGVFLYLAVDKNQTVIFPDYIKPRPVDGIDWDTVPNYVESDYFLGEPYTGKVYTVFLPYLPNKYEGSFRLTVTSTFATHHMRVAISKPIYGSYDELLTANTKSTQNMAYNFFGCMYAVAGIAADLTPGIGCLKAAFDNTVLMAIDKHAKDESIRAEDVANSIGMTALGCIPGEAGLSTGFKIAKGMASMYGGASDAGGAASACGDFADDLMRMFTQVVGYESHDPNAKYGPAGKDASVYVPSDMPYNYIVTYENDSAATAPAQQVIITDTLDKNVFDIHSFKAVGFGFGDTSYMFKPNDGDTVDIDMRPAKPIIVRVFYNLDADAGILTWTFRTLNPDTYELIDNVDDGFLPPNRTASEGEGSVFYAISPLSTLAEGTKIKNTAHIVFDWNEEIPTKTWQNVTDNTPPESTVKPLPEISVDKNFQVHWKGIDERAGIFSYNVYVSENDSAYYPWLIETHDTSAVFSGTFGSTYKFYTVATDSAGNKEAAPTIYDAMTRLSGTGVDTFGAGSKMQFRLYPNPAKTQINADCYLPEGGSIRLDVLNVCGHPVMEPVKRTGIRGTNNVQLDVSKLPAGYYFVRILTRYGVQTRKVVIQ